MSKPIEKVKAGLKLKTEEKSGVLTLKVGAKKHVLPFEVRLLQSDSYLFVHIPPCAEILKIGEESVTVVDNADEAAAAAASFRKSRKRTGGGRAAKAVELPSELAAALKTLGPDQKLAYDKNGQIRLVRRRTRTKAKK